MKKTESNKAAGELDFNQLVAAIRYADAELSAQASRAVNLSLTLRNWLIGCYIAEYELNGEDRAAYGEKVLSELSSVERYQQLQSTAALPLPALLPPLSSNCGDTVPTIPKASACISKFGKSGDGVPTIRTPEAAAA